MLLHNCSERLRSGDGGGKSLRHQSSASKAPLVLASDSAGSWKHSFISNHCHRCVGTESCSLPVQSLVKLILSAVTGWDLCNKSVQEISWKTLRWLWNMLEEDSAQDSTVWVNGWHHGTLSVFPTDEQGLWSNPAACDWRLRHRKEPSLYTKEVEATNLIQFD